jgi:5'-3' exonuclease
METMTITVKTKKAKRIIEDLIALDELCVAPPEMNKIQDIETQKGDKSIDVSWIPKIQQAHAKEILSAYKKGKKALNKNLPLKSAKDFLNEL